MIDTDAQREKLAGYFAKYATKGSDAKGLLVSRIRSEGQIGLLPVNDHLARLIRAAWNLGIGSEEINADRWAHQFGYGGHFLTKSLTWSTTFKVLRQRRADHNAAVRQKSWEALSPEARIVIDARWEYAGSGYHSSKEARFAALERAS